MITVIRDYFKGGKVILWVIIAAFVIGLMPMAFRSLTSTSQWALRINGQEIEKNEFLMEQERQRERLIAFRDQYGEYADWLLSMMGATSPQTLAVQSLIRQELVNQFADELGIQASQDYIAQKMGEPQFIAQELGEIVPPQMIDSLTGVNHAMLAKYLQHRGISTDMFEREIERKLTDKLMTNFIISTMYVPRFDVNQRYQAEHAKKSFSILMIALKDLLKKEKEGSVSDEEIEKFYTDQNKQAEQYWVPEKRTGTLWIFDSKNYGITITNENIENYYEKNKIQKFIDAPGMVQVRRILIAASDADRFMMHEKALLLKEEIDQDSTQFSAIAKRASNDKESAQNGGLLEPFARGSREQAFDRTAFLLPEDGAVSDVIETKDGFEILQRVKKTPQQFKSLSDVKEEIEESLRKQKFKSQFTADMRELLENKESLDELIAQKGGKPEQLENLTPKDSTAAEHLFKLKIGEQTFFVDDATGAAVQLNAVQDRYLPSLESIKKTVINDFHEYKARKALQEKLAEAKKRVDTISMKELQKEFEGARFIQTGWLTPGQEEAQESLKQKGIPVAKMLQMEKIGAVITESDSETGFVVRVDEIEPLNQQQFNEKEAEITRALQQERAQQYLEGFVASLHRNAKIETNESIITLQV